MSLFRVQIARVPGTRNSHNPCQIRRVPGVPGVPGLCARVHANAHSRSRAHTSDYFPRVHTRNTRNTRNNPCQIRLVAVPGTRNTKTIPGTAMATQKTAPKNLRAEMPKTAEFIDACREAFGAAEINASIRAGIDGQPTFYASENGREIGTKNKNEGLSLSQIVIGPLSRTTQAGKAEK